MRVVAIVGVATLFLAQPTGAVAKAPAHVTLGQALSGPPRTVPKLGWSLRFHGAYHQRINLAPCDDDSLFRVGPYVHAEYVSSVSQGVENAALVVIAVFASPAQASAAMSSLVLLARKCPAHYRSEPGRVETTVSRRAWGPAGWRGYLIAGTSTNLEEKRTEGGVSVYAVRGNVLVEASAGNVLRAASMARQSMWARQITSTMIGELDRQMT